jgi:GNAT superfamily N-acetyltransferase
MLTFSEAIPADVPAIVKLVNRAYSPAPEAPGWAGERSFQPGDRTNAVEVRELIGSAASVLIVGRRDGLLNSCCSITSRSAETACLGLFAVEPDKQSGGAGRQTLEYAESLARSHFGASRMEIEVMEHHVPFRQWYSRSGYHATGNRSAFPQTVDQKEAWLIHMEKQLQET